MKTSNYISETPSSIPLDNPIVVVCAADDNFAMPLSITICSALANLSNNRKMLLFVIDGGITKRNKRRILKSLSSEQCEVKWLPKPEAFNDKVVLPNTLLNSVKQPNSTFYRLLIPELIPSQFTKAIYLDCDLVVTEDLEKLWNVNIGDNYLLAVERLEFLGPFVSSPGGLMNWKELGFSQDCKYFNAGVLVFNLEKWRSNNMCTKALDYLAHNQEYIRWADQCVLNAVVAGCWGELDSRWNLMEARDRTQEEVNDAFIVHYTSSAKPWVAIGKNPASDLFFHYLTMTDWSGYRHTLPQRLWRRLKRETKSLLKILQLQ